MSGRSYMDDRTVVFGSLAYDLTRRAPDRDEYARPARQPDRQPEPAAAPAPRPQNREKNARHTAAALCLGCATAGILLVTALFGQMRLTALNDRAVAAEAQAETLRARQTMLRIQYEETFDLAQIEDYAVNELGMQRPRSDQICYVEADAPDKATVLAGSGAENAGERVFAFLDTIGACFH